jgi:hypothetical protein
VNDERDVIGGKLVRSEKGIEGGYMRRNRKE